MIQVPAFKRQYWPSAMGLFLWTLQNEWKRTLSPISWAFVVVSSAYFWAFQHWASLNSFTILPFVYSGKFVLGSEKRTWKPIKLWNFFWIYTLIKWLDFTNQKYSRTWYRKWFAYRKFHIKWNGNCRCTSETAENFVCKLGATKNEEIHNMRVSSLHFKKYLFLDFRKIN